MLFPQINLLAKHIVDYVEEEDDIQDVLQSFQLLHKLQAGRHIDWDDPNAENLRQAGDKFPKLVHIRVLLKHALRPIHVLVVAHAVLLVKLQLLLFIDSACDPDLSLVSPHLKLANEVVG